MADINGRSRTWAFIVYPESLPDNWLEIARDLHTPGAISPLHDKDVNPTGEKKKPHYHILLKFANKKSLDQLINIAQSFNSNVFPQPVDNFDGYLRYLIHIDNPEKYQYEPKDIIPLCGLDIETYFAPTKSAAAEISREIYEFILDHDKITEIDELAPYCTKEWIYVLNNYPNYFIRGILSSRRYKAAAQERRVKDKC